jgi:peroxiredoxin (alkyl hydroperoxide reductase subunit C)
MFNTLKVGHKAPDFKLKGAKGGELGEWNLSEFKGKWTVFFFYPADFTFVCPTEVKSFQVSLNKFEEKNAVVLGCSVDSPHVHLAWAESLGGIDYPLLSDVHHSTSIDYNVYVEEDAVTLRGTFIIDPEGILRWYQISDNNIGRNVDEVLRVLSALQTEKLCPAEWTEGGATLN